MAVKSGLIKCWLEVHGLVNLLRLKSKVCELVNLLRLKVHELVNLLRLKSKVCGLVNLLRLKVCGLVKWLFNK